MTNREDAVSEAIGGVLLIALVLIGAAIVGVYVMSQPLPEKIPKVQFSVKRHAAEPYHLEHEGGESLIDRRIARSLTYGRQSQITRWTSHRDGHLGDGRSDHY